MQARATYPISLNFLPPPSPFSSPKVPVTLSPREAARYAEVAVHARAAYRLLLNDSATNLQHRHLQAASLLGAPRRAAAGGYLTASDVLLMGGRTHSDLSNMAGEGHNYGAYGMMFGYGPTSAHARPWKLAAKALENTWSRPAWPERPEEDKKFITESAVWASRTAARQVAAATGTGVCFDTKVAA